MENGSVWDFSSPESWMLVAGSSRFLPQYEIMLWFAEFLFLELGRVPHSTPDFQSLRLGGFRRRTALQYSADSLKLLMAHIEFEFDSDNLWDGYKSCGGQRLLLQT